MKIVYLVLCIVGTIFPWSQVEPWLFEHGLVIPLLIREAFSTNISAFAWYDVLVSAVVVLIFVVVEGRRLKISHLWVPFVAMFTVGVSLALPLFLLQRKYALEHSNNWFNRDAGKARAG